MSSIFYLVNSNDKDHTIHLATMDDNGKVHFHLPQSEDQLQKYMQGHEGWHIEDWSHHIYTFEEFQKLCHDEPAAKKVVEKAKKYKQYLALGAEIRTLKTLTTKAFVDAGQILPKKYLEDMRRVQKYLNRFCSTAEDRMFAEFPNLGDEHCSVFYGDVTNVPRNDVDLNVHEFAEEIMSGILSSDTGSKNEKETRETT